MPVTNDIENDGFALAPGACSEALLSRIETILNGLTNGSGLRLREGRVFAVRNLLVIAPQLLKIVTDDSLLALLRTAIPEQSPVPLGAILFDKIPEANWKVPAHQDVSLPVAERIDVPGFGGWSRKQDVWYVEPPFDVLDRMIALRIHLDDCPAGNGALEVVPGTHRSRLPDADMRAFSPADFQTCAAQRGDVLLMKPLLVHRSASSTAAAHRRVLHVLYGGELPGGLKPAVT